MRSVARVIQIICLGCVITLSGPPVGMLGLVCPESLSTEDLGGTETASLLAATRVDSPLRSGHNPRRKTCPPVESRKTRTRRYQWGLPPGDGVTGHQLANGLNAPLRS